MDNKDNYIVSARKYRPKTFASVVGQEALTTTLRNAVKSRKLAHAYLFCVPVAWARRRAHVSSPKPSTVSTPPTMARPATNATAARHSTRDAR